MKGLVWVNVSKHNVEPASEHLKDLLSGEELLSYGELAERLNIPVTRVSDLLDARKLVAVNIDGARRVPALLIDGHDEILKFGSSAITVLHDGGYSSSEIVEYLFTEDESLPGRPIDALHGHGAREVIRRAQAMAL